MQIFFKNAIDNLPGFSPRSLTTSLLIHFVFSCLFTAATRTRIRVFPPCCVPGAPSRVSVNEGVNAAGFALSIFEGGGVAPLLLGEGQGSQGPGSLQQRLAEESE